MSDTNRDVNSNQKSVKFNYSYNIMKTVKQSLNKTIEQKFKRE